MDKNVKKENIMDLSKIKFTCPDCGKDISAHILSTIENYKKNNDGRKKAGTENLHKYFTENREKVKEIAAKASMARPVETFAKQGDTINETNRRIADRFAELILSYHEKGLEINHDEIMKQARDEIKKELAAERLGKKREKMRIAYRKRKEKQLSSKT